MLFHSLQFLIFFPIVVWGYFALPYRHRWWWLLLASYYFYAAWRPPYLLLLLATQAIDYYVALRIDRTASRNRKRAWLALSLTSNLGVLFLFKYLSFFATTAASLAAMFDVPATLPVLKLVLPLGISFYVFQSLSYTIDVYWGVQKVEERFTRLSLFVTFFPQLVAGPIERSTSLMPQFDRHNDFRYDRVASGLKLMAWGFFKKLVIADRISPYVNTVYNDPSHHHGIAVLLATYLFAMQIYCDFSAYSDIAIGAARVLGYDLMRNFRRPYLARSVREFWSRWHISLSTWFRDYLYIPLGGNRVSRQRVYLNLFIVFLVSGLWHGANWTFVVWGVLHGTYVILGLLTAKARERAWQTLGAIARNRTLRIAVAWFSTMTLVLFAWIFFRANNLRDSVTIISNLFDFHGGGGFESIIGGTDLLIAALAIVVLEAVQYVHEKNGAFMPLFDARPSWQRWAVYYGLVLVILLFGEYTRPQEFIYFQF